MSVTIPEERLKGQQKMGSCGRKYCHTHHTYYIIYCLYCMSNRSKAKFTCIECGYVTPDAASMTYHHAQMNDDNNENCRYKSVIREEHDGGIVPDLTEL